MAHGLNSVLKRGKSEGKGGIGSRRIFAPHFKLQVLDSYRNDADCKGNQRATARKYGIHRRQIQKWLQVEGNLRSSVGDGPGRPEAPRSGRLRDDEARVPALSPAPLDFTAARAPPDPAAPIDLSLKRPASPAASAPATYCPPSPLRAPSPLSLARPHPDVWDLSTKRKCDSDCAPKPVKLFKPYLDDVEDAPRPPCCSAAFDATYYYNNNNVYDIKSEYTLHELQPRSPVNYYYTFPAAYQAEYEPFCVGCEDPGYGQGVVPLKQRHSYSLDFKLSAIECYYQDSVCKGNQRAVATKYNIHRRQVQKWLKQADELRQKNENIKTQTVR
ncbi:BrkDBD domain containing protein [Asbolus verrucosus]|uniref:BrkDBD domain containing protein n=1 Tax=Asbolus verrucosus TaxID=1661398 RepID=A0A482V603_ASBVE|nr:BrkDBD domain containing protein [Asbolus verrucosus]